MKKSFLLRMEESLYRKIQARAKSKSLSLNQYCLEVLSQGEGAQSEKWIALLKNYFGDKLLAIALFGSYARGTQTKESDKDILIVLDSKVPLKSVLYREWETLQLDKIDPALSPHFSHIPNDLASLGSLWLEMALDAKILWDRTGCLQKTLQGIKMKILEAEYVRKHSYGVPYWIRPKTK